MINCRIFPGVDPNAVKAELERVVADPDVKVTRNDDYVASLASPLRPDVTAAYTKAVHALHPNQPIFPFMGPTAAGRSRRSTIAPTARTKGCRCSRSTTMWCTGRSCCASSPVNRR